eukprot:804148-Pyramimonas_sp.AAC.1
MPLSLATDELGHQATSGGRAVRCPRADVLRQSSAVQSVRMQHTAEVRIHLARNGKQGRHCTHRHPS